MPTIILTVPPRIEREIIRVAKKAFPREMYGILLGTVAGNAVHLDELYVPEDVDEFATDCSVTPQPGWFADANDFAKDEELVSLGWVHSHPYRLRETTRHIMRDRAHSEADMDAFPPGMLISGICVVQEFSRKGTPTLRSSIRWWGPHVSVAVKSK